MKVYDYDFSTQFSDVSYIGGCQLLISGVCHALSLLIGYESEYQYPHCMIASMIHKYYYEREKHLFQFGWDVWKILYKVNRSQFVENELIKSFVGNEILIETRKSYWHKYRFISTINHFNDLLKQGTIQLCVRRQGTQKVWDSNNNRIFLNNNNYLYIFSLKHKRQFKKVYHFLNDMLDRKAWTTGTEVEIYSASLGGWIEGEIIKISPNRQCVVVSYDGSKFGSKYMLKTVNINDVDLVRSTQDFIYQRNKWNIGSKIEIYSNGDNLLVSMVIESVIPKDNKNNIIDTFRVKYKKKSDGLYYTKRLDQWSWQCRHTQNITNKKLRKYKFARKCQVWNENKQIWEMYDIIDIIPKHQYVIVRKTNCDNSNFEKFVDFNSGRIRLIKK